MEYVAIIVFLVAAIFAGAFFFLKTKKNKMVKDFEDVHALEKNSTAYLTSKNLSMQERMIQVEKLSAQKISNQNKLVEITDHKVLGYINNLVPELAKVGKSIHKNTRVIKENGEVLYRAVIPAGEKLVKSKSMDGAVRGFYRGQNGIKGQANFMAVQTKKGTELVANAASTAMGVAAMVVGQYYMDQINSSLNVISEGVSQISDFQNNEYRSRVSSLIAHIKKITDFQTEILENNELRFSKITQLDNLEEECTKLLGQSNLMLEAYTNKNNLDYVSYERKLRETQNWYTYQKLLLDILCQISDLRFALYFGKASREFCRALLPAYIQQAQEMQERLSRWHDETAQRLKIDMSGIRRKREGLDGAIHFLPGLFNDKYNFRSMEESTAQMIEIQSSGRYIVHQYDNSDLYSEDVQLIVKGEKIYYLPTDGQ